MQYLIYNLTKYLKSFFLDAANFVVDIGVIAPFLVFTVLFFFARYLESFSYVLLCQYNLGTISFFIVRSIVCCAFCFSSVEYTFGALSLYDSLACSFMSSFEDPYCGTEPQADGIILSNNYAHLINDAGKYSATEQLMTVEEEQEEKPIPVSLVVSAIFMYFVIHTIASH